MTAASWLLALLGAAGLWLAGNHYPWGWALFAGAQVLAVRAEALRAAHADTAKLPPPNERHAEPGGAA